MTSLRHTHEANTTLAGGSALWLLRVIGGLIAIRVGRLLRSCVGSARVPTRSTTTGVASSIVLRYGWLLTIAWRLRLSVHGLTVAGYVWLRLGTTRVRIRGGRLTVRRVALLRVTIGSSWRRVVSRSLTTRWTSSSSNAATRSTTPVAHAGVQTTAARVRLATGVRDESKRHNCDHDQHDNDSSDATTRYGLRVRRVVVRIAIVQRT